MIAQAAPEPTPLLTIAVCAAGLVPLAYLVFRHAKRRPVLQTNPAAFARSNPMVLAPAALAYCLLYLLAGWAVVTAGPAIAIGAELGTLLAGLVLYALAVRPAFRPRGTRAERIGRGFLVLWAAMPVIYGAFLLLQWLGFEEPQKPVQWLAERRDGWRIVALHAVLVAPVAEEICFRGLVYPALRQLRGPRYAILMSALIFGLVHVLPAVVVPMILFGVVMAWLSETNGSILPCVLGHIAFNVLTVLQLLLV
ncbi:MAG: lysostaphin resistance A-like protein [Planctomycetota bacterium]